MTDGAFLDKNDRSQGPENCGSCCFIHSSGPGWVAHRRRIN